MSIQKLCNVFNNITQTRDWSLRLVRINESETDGATYVTRELHLVSANSLDRLLSDIAAESSSAKLQKKYDAVARYDGTTNKRIIYSLESSNDLITDNYHNLVVAAENPDVEIAPLEFGAQAYILSSRMDIEGDMCNVRLMAVRNPIVTLKHKFWYNEGAFTEITDKILSLKTTIDVVAINDSLYFLSLEGEKLFCMERAYKIQSKITVRKIIDKKLVSDEHNFEKVASSKQFPRTLVGYKSRRLELLEDRAKRPKICKMFGISIKDGLIDTSDQKNAERVIKFLCYRAMLDIDGNPVEVDGVRDWN